MLHIILLILKLIGITLLVLLGILLLLFLTIMLVPIRYRIEAEHGEKLWLDGRAGWFFNLMHARFSYLEGKLHIRIGVLWFVLFDNLKPKKRKIKKKRRKTNLKSIKLQKGVKADKEKRSEYKKQKVNQLAGNEQSIKDEAKKASHGKEVDLSNLLIKTEEKVKNEITEEINSEFKETTEVNNDEASNINSNRDLDRAFNKDTDKNTIKQKKFEQEESIIHENGTNKEEDIRENLKKFIFKKLFHKVIEIKNKMVAFFCNIKRKIIVAAETISGIKHKAGLIQGFIKNEINKEGFQVTFESLRKMIKHILPTKLKSRIVFGTGDPCSTGQALGVVSVLYSFYGDKVQIIPDFENKIFEGKHYAKGRIRLVTILIIVIKLIVDKRFKRLKNNFQILKEAL